MSDPDPSISLPELPALTRGLGGTGFPLQRTPPLDHDPPFTLTGARAAITGGCDRGVNAVRAADIPVLSRLRLDGAITASATLTPVGLERRLRLGRAGALERMVIALADPVCFFEWRVEPDRPVALGWIVPAHTGGLRWRATERGLVVESGAGRILFAFSRPPAELLVDRHAGPGGAPGEETLRVRARLESVDGGSVRLAVAGVGASDDEGRVLRVMGRSHVVVPARRSAALRILEERLALECPDDSGLAAALAWATLRLADRPPATRLTDRELRLALASLATGDPAPARSLLAARDPDDGDLHLLLVARYLAWTGDLRTVGATWPATRERAEALLERARPDSSLHSRSLRELIPAAEEVGDLDLARRLRSAVAAMPEEESAAGAGGDVGGDAGDAGDAGRDAGGDADGDDLLGAAAMVEAVVEGLLGAEPDAPRGRLVLCPRLPRSWTRCAVRNLTVGEAAVELELEREGGRHLFTLRQTRGGAPITAIFEPELEGAGVVSARVDGEPAELDPVAAEGRVRVPVQLVLDHERRVEVEIDGSDA